MQENSHSFQIKEWFINPHKVLGLKQKDPKQQVIRLWRPGFSKCEIEVQGKTVEAKKMDESGLYEYVLPSEIKMTDYRIFHCNGKAAHDPYAFDQVFGELDIYLVGKGLHYELYDLLGATQKTHQGVKGTHFAVWAPNALSVSLIGDFNGWNGQMNPMRIIGSTGVWEIFIPGIGEGEKYKFEITTREGIKQIKSDPVAHFFEMRPKTASIVFNVNRFEWNDREWIKSRGKYRFENVPMNIYEVHLGSWKKENGDFLNYRDLAKRLVDYCKKMHFTHVELIGICEHPLDESWGYQVIGYFASTSRYGTPEDFQYFVDYLHQHEIGVILDWVPAHFPTDSHSLARFDGTYLYEHIDPRQGYHPHWNTHIFNYGRWEVSNFLVASALYWFKKMHIDGLRVDAVASMLYLDYGRGPGEWIPNSEGTNINFEAIEFIKHMNSIVHQLIPSGLMIAEESTSFPGVTTPVEKDGLGFDFKWSLGWMNDTFDFFENTFLERGKNLGALTHIREFIFNEKHLLVLSHDEVVHEKKSLIEKMSGDPWQQFAGLRLLLSYMICFPGKKLLFMGGEFGQRREWNCKESLDWYLLRKIDHVKLQEMVGAINNFYLKNEALFANENESKTFDWIGSPDQENAILCYLRKGEKQTLLCLHHFTPTVLDKYLLKIEGVSKIEEVFNTDREEWGGSGIINQEIPIEKGRVEISVPPLSTLIFEITFEFDEN